MTERTYSDSAASYVTWSGATGRESYYLLLRASIRMKRN